VLELYLAGPSPYPQDGKPIAGVHDVEVVIRGAGQTRRFGAADLGGVDYGAAIMFPEAGDWDLRVRFGPGSYGQGDEILLGKGAIRVDGAPVRDGGGGVLPKAPLPVAAGVRLLAFVGAAVVRRRRLRPTAAPTAGAL
jgi:hypothetical protein